MLIYFFKLQKLTQPLNQYSELERMLALRKMGFSYTVLADTFHVPKETIRYLCRRFGLGERNVTTTVKRLAPTPRPKPTYTEEKINPGKTYAEYLAEDRERKRRHLTTH